MSKPIFWTAELDKKITDLRREGYSRREVAENLGISLRSVSRRCQELRERAVRFSEDEYRSRQATAAERISQAEENFAKMVLDSTGGMPREAWRLYHERKNPPAKCASLLGVAMPQFWDLLAQQTVTLREKTAAAAKLSSFVPPPRKRLAGVLVDTRGEGRHAA